MALLSATAGLWMRALAFVLDYLIIAAYLVLLAAIGLAANRVWPGLAPALFANRVSAQLLGFLLVTLPAGLYFALSEASHRQATWGKRRLGLCVIRTDGTRLSVGRSLLRTALKSVPWELSHTLIWQVRFAGPAATPPIGEVIAAIWVLIGANLLSLLVSRTHQTLYDWLAGTLVVRR